MRGYVQRSGLRAFLVAKHEHHSNDQFTMNISGPPPLAIFRRGHAPHENIFPHSRHSNVLASIPPLLILTLLSYMQFASLPKVGKRIFVVITLIIAVVKRTSVVITPF